jgi:hypothetical protein
MDIGDWKTTAELNAIYSDARKLGVETCIAELEAFGFTIVPPEKVAPKGFADRMLAAILRIAEEEGEDSVDLNTRAQKDRPVYGRNLFHLVAKDPVFAEAIMNPVALTLGKYLCGASARLFSNVAFVKRGEAGVTKIHSDSVGIPPPLPAYGHMCNISWILTDYTEETGTFFLVPGSHRYCRHPTASEQPKMMGGQNEDDIGTAAIAKPGSLLIFNGNLWHGTYPKTDAGLRVHVVTALARNYLDPAEDFSDVPNGIVKKYGPEFARLLGRDKWQGYGSGGPKYDRMLAVNRAQYAPSA